MATVITLPCAPARRIAQQFVGPLPASVVRLNDRRAASRPTRDEDAVARDLFVTERALELAMQHIEQLRERLAQR